MVYQGSGTIRYAIYKTIPYCAEEINASIEHGKDIPGVRLAMYKDGWIIVEPEDLEVDAWQRNRDDYRIEELRFQCEQHDHKDNACDEIKDTPYGTYLKPRKTNQ